ncbi:LysE family translocator [Bacillus alkalicellulosilyticus]|uniref:LysE family translocator n=1 Tax=Alkalihalobacterium alkalicellulosilyticum TaxID=1912214 RepID=UPI000997C4AA|nr:LysE family translocator [Bacillus alkalicellulosilyticus]
MSLFLGYVFLGLSLAAPIGPVNAAQLDTGIKKGFLHAWIVGLGATVADGFYMLLVFLGVVHFIDLPFMQTFLWIFGAFVLMYTGYESLLGANEVKVKSERTSEGSHFKSFMSGFFISLFNPLTILFWLGIFGSVLTKTVHTYGAHKVMLYTAAIFVGITIWDITMAGLSSTLRKYLTTRLLKTISILSGLSLIGFGIYFAIQAFDVIFL